MKKTGGYIFRLIKDNFFSLVGFEFIFKASAFILFVPLLIQLMNTATDNAGLTYITTRNIAKFMKNPVMIVMTVCILLIFICIAYYEVCCIWACFHNYRKGVKMTVPDIFTDGFAHLKKTSRRYGYRVYLQMAAITPLLCFHMTIILFDRLDILESCIRYLFRGIPSVYISLISAAAVIFLFSAATQKFGKSISMTESRIRFFFRRTWYLIVLNVLTGLILVVMYFVLVLISALVLRFFGSEKSALVYLIRIENVIYYVLAFFAGALGMISNVAMMFVFHNKQKQNEHVLTKKKKSFKRKIVTVLILIVFTSDVCTVAEYAVNGSHVLEDIFIGTEVTAHRGGARFVPENTMYGVEYAINSGADYIEIDVQLSADGVVFLLHDDSLKRTAGLNKLAYTMNYDEIASLDAGSYFDQSFSDAYIPTLDEVLAACKSKISLNIEIKKSKKSGELISKVLDLIRSYEMKEQCVITSTEYSYLKKVKETDPSVRTGFISNMLYGDAASLEYADFFSVKYVVVNENFVRAAHNAGKEVHVWTVNTKPLINRMKGLDVDCIITDNPVLCRKILSRKNDRKSFVEILRTFLYKNN